MLNPSLANSREKKGVPLWLSLLKKFSFNNQNAFGKNYQIFFGNFGNFYQNFGNFYQTFGNIYQIFFGVTSRYQNFFGKIDFTKIILVLIPNFFNSADSVTTF